MTLPNKTCFINKCENTLMKLVFCNETCNFVKEIEILGEKPEIF